MERLGLDKPALVGHDLGGMIAVGYAVRHQSDLSKLAILDTYPYAEVSLRAKLPLKLLALPKVPGWMFGSRRGIALSLKAGVVNRSLVTDELVDEYWRPLRDDARARKVSGEILRIDQGDMLEPRSRVAELDLPTLIIWAERDRLIPLSVGKELHRVIPGSELKTIPQCSHFLPEDRPEEVSRLLVEFL
jgi:pimeloyl-ACP methyl ester carboxylesterase